MNFSENLTRIRKEQGYTQEEVASYLYVTRQAVSKWENGLSEPSLLDIKTLCKLFGCTSEDLIGDSEGKVLSKVESKPHDIIFKALIIVFGILLLVNGIIISCLPNEIPVHANSQLVVDRYGSRYEMLLLVGAMTAIFVSAFILRLIAWKKPISGRNLTYINASLLAIIAFLGVLNLVAFGLIGAFKELRDQGEMFNQILGGILSTIMVVTGAFVHPKVTSQNLVLGIRTRYTLSKKERWDKCNAFGSYVMLPLGISSFYISLLLTNEASFIVPAILLSVSVITMIVFTIIVAHKDTTYNVK